MKTKKKKEPYVGQKIYVDTDLYLSHGLDDFEGGIAVISKVVKDPDLPKNHHNHLMVGIKERPGTLYNWRYLKEKQEQLKERFKENKAHPIPDDRPEFNRWD